MRTETVTKNIFLVSPEEFLDWLHENRLDDYFYNSTSETVFEDFLSSQMADEGDLHNIIRDLERENIFIRRNVSISYPDEIGMGYNHNYIIINLNKSCDKISHFTVTAHNDYGTFATVKAVNKNFNVKILLDEVVRAIAFEDYSRPQPLWELDYTVKAVLINGEEVELLTNFTEFLHGYLKSGQRLHNLGAIEREPYIKKILVFENFANKFSIPLIEASAAKPYLYVTSANEPLEDIDAEFHTYGTISHPTVLNVNIAPGEVTSECSYVFKKAPNQASGAFSVEFNEPFQPPTPDDLVIYLIPVKRKCGVFLRWMDSIGLWHSFLFENGTEEFDATPDSNTIEEHNNVFGMYQTLNRPVGLTSKTVITCGAPCLDDSLYEDVSSIADAQYVEMYKNNGYIPVLIDAAKLKKNTSKAHNTVEIKIVLQENSTIL